MCNFSALELLKLKTRIAKKKLFNYLTKKWWIAKFIFLYALPVILTLFVGFYPLPSPNIHIPVTARSIPNQKECYVSENALINVRPGNGVIPIDGFTKMIFKMPDFIKYRFRVINNEKTPMPDILDTLSVKEKDGGTVIAEVHAPNNDNIAFQFSKPFSIDGLGDIYWAISNKRNECKNEVISSEFTKCMQLNFNLRFELINRSLVTILSFFIFTSAFWGWATLCNSAYKIFKEGNFRSYS